MKKLFTEIIERQELIQKLIDGGHGELVDVLLQESSWTKKGRLNKSATCRTLSWKPKQLDDAINECKQLLIYDFEENDF